MAFELPNLPYAHDALNPHIDTATMEIHHGKHHAAYIAKLNAAVSGSEMEGKSLEELIKNHTNVAAVRNNGRRGCGTCADRPTVGYSSASFFFHARV